MGQLKKILIPLLAALLIVSVVMLSGCDQQTEEKEQEKTEKSEEKKDPPTQMVLATTTSTKDSGLLDEIIPDFEEQYNVTVKTVAVGTGEALAMGEKGEADVLLVHARASEDKFMADGNGSVRKDVMYNDFVLLGSEDDPAAVKGMDSAADACKKIADAKEAWVTRGDDSGTHKKELKIWESAGVTPSGSWYESTGQGMGASLQIANQKKAYILADRATYLSQKDNLDLEIVVEGDKALFNPYGVIGVNPDKFPNVHNEEAMDFIKWITSVDTQEMIGEFGKGTYGEALFTPDSEEWKEKKS